MTSYVWFLLWLVLAQASAMILYRWLENRIWETHLYTMQQFQSFNSEKQMDMLIKLFHETDTKEQICYLILFVIALPLLLVVLLVSECFRRLSGR